MHETRTAVRLLGVLLGALLAALAPRAAHATPTFQTADITGVVTDSASGRPIQSAEISVTSAGRIVANAQTDEFGRYVVHDVGVGTFAVTARFIGYRRVTRTVEVRQGATEVRTDFTLAPVPLTLSVQAVTASVPLALDTRTGDQRFRQDAYHGAPTQTTSAIVQQSVAGAARAPTGEVHIRGQHAEYTYYVDGVPVPAGISGSLNELFDPSVVNQIDFQTGGWDAEYGNKNAAVVNVTTRIPGGGFHAEVAGFAGNFATRGQSASVSNNVGPFGFFLSGSHQSTDMRREPVVFDTTTRRGVNFHNHGDDTYLFGKMQFTPGAHDVLDLEGNWSRTKFQVPYDSAGGIRLDDRQHDVNGFINAGYRHRFALTDSSETGDELFAALFYRFGSLDYIPGAQDVPSFVFYPDTTPYNLSERRSFATVGVKGDYTLRAGHSLQMKTGTLASITTGRERFRTTSATGSAGPASVSGLRGSDVGVYAQAVYTPVEQFQIRAGVRYDAHTAPFAGTRTQLSPRLRLNFFPSPSTTFWLYYGRLFIPTNVEDLRAITSAAQGDTAGAPTLPERADFYEAGMVHRFPFGVVSRLSAFHKRSSPGIDDNTVPGSAIVTSVNIARVWITGIEGVLEIRPGGPLSGYLNASVNHAYGHGPVTGGFFPAELPQGYFDLDHDQRYSAVASATYSPGRFYVSATGNYGSGLTNGREPGPGYSTALFARNASIKVAPSFITSLSSGYSFTVGEALVRPEIFIDNLFDRRYILKGAFFSGVSVGRPRSVQLRLTASF